MIGILGIMILVACFVMDRVDLNERAVRMADGWEG